MRELSLFSGAGGGLLGTKLLGWTTIGYVEYEKYCQKILEQRIKDGILDEAPIYGDIRTFNSMGFAESYTGLVDVITAGFPCQPFSVAGQRKADQDERNMWPQTKDCISIIRPQYCFLENVPGLLTHKYIQRIFGDLAEMGYDCKWGIIGADDVGAPHRRKRLWILAYPSRFRRRGRNNENAQGQGGTLQTKGPCSGNKPGNVADSRSQRLEKRRGVFPGNKAGEIPHTSTETFDRTNAGWWDTDPADIRNPTEQGLQEWGGETVGQPGEKQKPERPDCEKADIPDTKRLPRTQQGEPSGVGRQRESTKGNRGGKGSTQPQLGRVAHGVAHRVDRLKAIGNGQVPAVVRAAWEILNDCT